MDALLFAHRSNLNNQNSGIACEETFNRYSNLISSWDNANYEETMVQKNKLYAGIKKAAEERDFYERKLVCIRL